MSLARAWTRQMYGASGAILLVPAALVAALLVLGLSGGFGSLGALGQAFAGPAVPAAPRIPGVKVSGRRARALPVAAAPTNTAAPLLAGGGSVGLGGTIPRLPTAQGIGSIGPVRGTAPGTPGRPRPGGPGSGSGSGGVAGGQPTLVDNVVSLGTSVTKNIPGPVGGLTTQILQSLANTVDGMVPHAVESTTSPVTGLVKRVANSLHRS